MRTEDYNAANPWSECHKLHHLRSANFLEQFCCPRVKNRLLYHSIPSVNGMLPFVPTSLNSRIGQMAYSKRWRSETRRLRDQGVNNLNRLLHGFVLQFAIWLQKYGLIPVLLLRLLLRRKDVIWLLGQKSIEDDKIAFCWRNAKLPLFHRKGFLVFTLRSTHCLMKRNYSDITSQYCAVLRFFSRLHSSPGDELTRDFTWA